MERQLNDQQLVRRQKAEDLKQKGINPFGNAFKTTSNSKIIKESFENETKESLDQAKHPVIIAGRIMSKRRMGKMCFMHIQDRYGLIQIVINKADLGEEPYELVKASDMGDIIGIEGYVYRTNPTEQNPNGELSVYALKYIHLTKALSPFPEKFHGLTDIEERYRRRYLDLIMNDDARKVAFTRPKILEAIRKFLSEKEFIEVETPVLTTLLTGASARPFKTHHNTQDLDMYLRIALELNLKRLIVGGMEKVFEIGRTFRNEGMDPQHNPEFTMMELYEAYSNLDGMMDLTEEMYKYIAKNVFGKTKFKYLGNEIELDGTWKRVSMVEAIKEKTGIDFSKEISFEEACKLAKEHEIEVEKHFSTGHIINAFFEKYVEETLIQPTFLYGHPIEILANVVVDRKGSFKELFTKLKQDGYVRVYVDGSLKSLDETIELDKNKRHNIDVVIDRIVIKENIETRLNDSIELALKMSDGTCVIKNEEVIYDNNRTEILEKSGYKIIRLRNEEVQAMIWSVKEYAERLFEERYAELYVN